MKFLILLSTSTCIAGYLMLSPSQSLLQKILHPDKPRIVVEDLTPTISVPAKVIIPPPTDFSFYFNASDASMGPRVYFPAKSFDNMGFLKIPSNITQLEVYLEDKNGKRYKAKWEEVK